MSHEDPLGDCPRTFEHLIARVRDGVRAQRTALYDVEAYTVCSLARHRHAAGKLSQRYRQQVRDLLLEVLRSPDLLSPNVGEYARVTEIDLSIDHFRPGALVDVVSTFKDNQRMGWVERGIADAESIASHVFGAYMLGLFFLPHAGPPPYDKRRILDMVLVHDIAEAITGDIPSPRKKEEDSREERRWVSYLSLTSTYGPVGEDVSKILELWQSFEERGDLNARVARDLDRLDNLVQLHVYAERGFDIGDFDTWKAQLLSRIDTDVGIAIRDEIMRHLAASPKCQFMEALVRRVGPHSARET